MANLFEGGAECLTSKLLQYSRLSYGPQWSSQLPGWGSFAPETSGMSCAPDWESPDNLDYTIFLFVLGFIVPMVVILVTSIRVTLTLKNNSSKAHGKQRNSHSFEE